MNYLKVGTKFFFVSFVKCVHFKSSRFFSCWTEWAVANAAKIFPKMMMSINKLKKTSQRCHMRSKFVIYVFVCDCNNAVLNILVHLLLSVCLCRNTNAIRRLLMKVLTKLKTRYKICIKWHTTQINVFWLFHKTIFLPLLI